MEFTDKNVNKRNVNQLNAFETEILFFVMFVMEMLKYEIIFCEWLIREVIDFGNEC